MFEPLKFDCISVLFHTVFTFYSTLFQDMTSDILRGVVISVSKKLGKDQSELNDLVSSLGGDYRWNYDSSCTHFIFQVT